MIKVAIVEDNAGFKSSLECVLQATDDIRCVATCVTGEDAIRKLPAVAPDVVLMDLNLPGINGAATTAQLREKLPDLDVIMLTAYNDPESIFSALRAGACGYLLKRVSAQEITDAVREARRGGAPMSSEIARKVIGAFKAPAVEEPVKSGLAPREQQVLALIAGGLSNKEIAEQLGITVETARSYIKDIYRKLHVHNRTQAAMQYRSG